MKRLGTLLGGVLLVACGERAPIERQTGPESDGERFVQVVAGARHTCALQGNGAVFCWGLGEAVDGSSAAVSTPRLIPDVEASALAAADNTTCAITQAHQVRCWGTRTLTVTIEDGLPLSAVNRLALGPGFGCAANPEGVYCWGKNARGQLARPLEVEASATAVLTLPGPVALLATGMTVLAGGDHRLCGWGDNSSLLVTAQSEFGVYTKPECEAVSKMADLAVGSVHACALDEAGNVKCWGERYYGQLGLGGSDEDTAAVPPYGSATSLPAPARAIAAGMSHTCALLEDAAVVCFGLNIRGQIGSVSAREKLHVLVPTAVTGLSGKVVSLGSGPTAQHTCAILEDGSVQCWGDDSAGQLGDSKAGYFRQ